MQDEFITADTPGEAITKYQIKVGHRIGNIQVTAVNATLVAPGVYRVWHEVQDARKIMLEYATQTEIVGGW